jgi:integrase
MPARQRGSTVKRGNHWGARWYDEGNIRQFRGGFETKSAARAWVDDRVDEVEALRRGEIVAASHRPQTVDDLLDSFLAKHGRTVDPATLRALTARLKHAREAFGDRHPDSLAQLELEDWRATLSPGVAHYVFRAFAQALRWGYKRKLTEREPSAGIANPRRKRHERREIVPFESWDEVEAVGEELDARYRAIAVFAVGTGLRPEEWIALHRSDVDRQARVVRVCRRFSGDQLKDGTKTVPERVVPLRQRVLDALDAMPPRIDTPILFPAPRGGYIDLERFRYRAWTPALKAAGIPHRPPYACRHTFATWAIEDGSIPLPQLATIMGTSVREIEDTYFRWLRRTDERLLAALDAYDQAVANG